VKAHPVTAAPITVSDATALAVVGLSPRQFRRFVTEQSIPFVRVGRCTVVRVDRLLEVFDRLSGASPRPATTAWDEEAVIAAAVRGSK
jgi:hypothetical protein